MTAAETTALTQHQITVLRLRADGHTHEEIASELDATTTTGADVREIEHAAERTIERARRTLDLVESLRRGPAEITATPETTIENLADRIYARGDDAGIKIDYCHADLYAHLRDALADRIEDDRLCAPAALTLTEDGRVTVGERSHLEGKDDRSNNNRNHENRNHDTDRASGDRRSTTAEGRG